jgi:MATE family multidrug resistance protein
MGLSQAGSIRVSNAYGRADWNRIRVIGKTTLITALLYGCFCAICFAIFRWQLPLIFNDNSDVVHLSAILLLFAAVFQISDATQATGAGLLRGIKDVKLPTLLVTLAYWVIGLPVGWLFAFHYHMGAAGMWLGLIIGLTLASVFLGSRFLNMVRKNDLPVGF